jgi:hypothetical protein
MYGEGGGITNSGTAVISSTTFARNSAYTGAGISNSGTLGVSGCTFSMNHAAYGGGGITNNGFTTVLNSTFSGNDGNIYAGGFTNDGQATISNSTFYSNSSAFTGAAFTNSTGTITLHNTIAAGNSITECYGTITDGGYNLDSANSCGFNPANGSLVDTDPLLGALANNLGPTQTHLPLAGSPVIDAGDPASCPPTDQRGDARPVDGNGDGIASCDIGSVEMYPYKVWLPMIIRE